MRRHCVASRFNKYVPARRCSIGNPLIGVTHRYGAALKINAGARRKLVINLVSSSETGETAVRENNAVVVCPEMPPSAGGMCRGRRGDA